jgi:hypothetical protein
MGNATEAAPIYRPNPSRVLQGIRDASRRAFSLLPPGRRMEAAFTLSMDALKLRVAGLRERGFSDPQIREILKGGRP